MNMSVIIYCQMYKYIPVIIFLINVIQMCLYSKTFVCM